MPPEVVSAGIKAGSSLLGGILGNRSQNKAADAQLQANREALGYQREQDTLRMAQAAKLWNAYNANRALLFQRYGLQMPDMENPYASGASGPNASARGTSLADFIARKSEMGV